MKPVSDHLHQIDHPKIRAAKRTVNSFTFRAVVVFLLTTFEKEKIL